MEWMDQALCRQTDPALFVPEGNSSDVYQAHEQAKAICRRCPVIEQCQDYALELATHATLWGVWAGRNARDIHAMVRKRNKAA